MKESPITVAKEFMKEFASNTGLNPEASNPIRYLWTDAFAVCNYLELYKRTNKIEYLNLALQLIEQVHHILGKNRGENKKKTWISGLDEKSGDIHPTIGGLRIGKEMNERMPGEPYNEILEWEMDGQYYHYLTKWIHALSKTAKVTRKVKYIIWASELAKTSHKAFVYSPYPDAKKRMYWKMSIDLSRPLVTSMGQHDPLDGFVTYNEVQNQLIYLSNDFRKSNENLNHEIKEIGDICLGMNLSTPDPLGIGGLLADALRITQLMINGHITRVELLEKVIHASLLGINSYLADNPLKFPAEYRLAFRELGLSIGLKGLEIMNVCIKKYPEIFTDKLKRNLYDLNDYSRGAYAIEEFWLDEKNRKTNNWKEHMDINTVMLATSLIPNGFLRI
jgi:hypothetical protein